MGPQGWLDSWCYNQITYCGEYKNYRPCSSTNQRVNWPHILIKESIGMVITDPDIANQYTLTEFTKGNEWLPTSSELIRISGFFGYLISQSKSVSKILDFDRIVNRIFEYPIFLFSF
ncbi:putative pectinesterase [Helianthus anomalus]